MKSMQAVVQVFSRTILIISHRELFLNFRKKKIVPLTFDPLAFSSLTFDQQTLGPPAFDQLTFDPPVFDPLSLDLPAFHLSACQK